MNRVFIIAKAGVNHNGSFSTAKHIIDIALKRPGTGMPPALMDRVVHGKALLDIRKNTLITDAHYRRSLKTERKVN